MVLNNQNYNYQTVDRIVSILNEYFKIKISDFNVLFNDSLDHPNITKIISNIVEQTTE